jgi:hypothetical protein
MKYNILVPDSTKMKTKKTKLLFIAALLSEAQSFATILTKAP